MHAPRELLDQAKAIAARATGIPVERQLISATHTHFAPAAMPCLGSRADQKYAAWLPAKIAEAIINAAAQLVPAEAGSASIADFEHTFCRQFIYHPNHMPTDPFGARSIRSNMHPGYQNATVTSPSGPVDSNLTVLSVRRRNGPVLAIVANYAMHYFDSKPLSSDYFGAFAEVLSQRLSLPETAVVMMSQGASGDSMWMDYSQPKRDGYTQRAYTEGVVKYAAQAFQGIRYRASIDLRMIETELVVKRRQPDAARVAWATELRAQIGDRMPKSQAEVYALEQFHILAEPQRTLRLQAIRIGDLAIAAWPNEVFGISGLKLREGIRAPRLMNITLANGAEGYIPPPEQHRLGGYTTWLARTASLNVDAETTISSRLLGLLNNLFGTPRSSQRPSHVETLDHLDYSSRPIPLRPAGLFAPAVPASKGNASRALYLAGGSLQVQAQAWRTARRISIVLWPAIEQRFLLAPGLSIAVGGGPSELKPRTWHTMQLTRSGNQWTVEWDGHRASGSPTTKNLSSLLEGFEGKVEAAELLRKEP